MRLSGEPGLICCCWSFDLRLSIQCRICTAFSLSILSLGLSMIGEEIMNAKFLCLRKDWAKLGKIQRYFEAVTEKLSENLPVYVACMRSSPYSATHEDFLMALRINRFKSRIATIANHMPHLGDVITPSPLNTQALQYPATDARNISLQDLAIRAETTNIHPSEGTPNAAILTTDEEAGGNPISRPSRTFSQVFQPVTELVGRMNVAARLQEIDNEYTILTRQAFTRCELISLRVWKDRGLNVYRTLNLNYRALGTRTKRLKDAAAKQVVEGRYVERLVHFSTLFSSLAVIATSKMAEEEKDAGGKGKGNWEVTFMLFYILWGFSVMISLYFDWLQTHSKVLNTVSHIGCCAIILYFFASILSIKTPTTVLPICINLGLVASLGVQRISPDVKDRIFTWIGTCLGMPYQPGGESRGEDDDV